VTTPKIRIDACAIVIRQTGFAPPLEITNDHGLDLHVGIHVETVTSGSVPATTQLLSKGPKAA
jgi:hypothetical protein